MTRTFCDLCNQEIAHSLAVIDMNEKLGPLAHVNLRAEVKFQPLAGHICAVCMISLLQKAIKHIEQRHADKAVRAPSGSPTHLPTDSLTK